MPAEYHRRQSFFFEEDNDNLQFVSALLPVKEKKVKLSNS